MRKKMIKFIVLILLIVMGGVLYSCQYVGEPELTLGQETQTAPLADESEKIKEDDWTMNRAEASENAEICVYVCGQVARAGVYTFQPGDRVEAAVEAAGGFSETADDTALNLADFLEDGQKIYVPAKGEDIQDGASEGGTTKEGLVNINKATAEELMTLPGIGASKAQKIIDYRENNGGFGSIDELKNISGIKDGVFEPIKDLICAD